MKKRILITSFLIIFICLYPVEAQKKKEPSKETEKEESWITLKSSWIPSKHHGLREGFLSCNPPSPPTSLKLRRSKKAMVDEGGREGDRGGGGEWENGIF